MSQQKFLVNKTNGESMTVEKHTEGNVKILHQLFDNCADVKIEKKEFQNDQIEVSVLLVYCEGLSDTKQLNQTIIPQLQYFFHKVHLETFCEKQLLSALQIASISKVMEFDQITTNVFSGQLVLFFDGLEAAYSIDITNPPQRNPEESSLEVSIIGPKDGFVEALNMNVALVRKRLKTSSLSYQQFIIGKRSQTKIGLLFIKDIVQPSVIEEVKKRITKIDMDAVYSSQELIELISEKPTSLFPLYDHTGRPDYVVASLLRGRFVILMDGLPTAIIAPMNLFSLLKSPEDIHLHYLFVSFERLFRLAGLAIALFLPGFYIAICTYHPDQLPLSLLATISVSRKGVPLPTPIEAFLMLLLFELFREAGVRLPNAIGQTLSVVGGLIIGDAAIRAGLTSPSMIVIVSITAVANFTLVNQSLIGVITIIRIGILLLSSVMGVFGFILSVSLVVIYLSNLRSFGISYLAPISPVTFGDLLPALLRPPVKYLRQRARILNPVDKTRRGNNE